MQNTPKNCTRQIQSQTVSQLGEMSRFMELEISWLYLQDPITGVSPEPY
jgi:hypothetical protein